MARIAGVDLPRTKRIEIGLTYIYGIGRKRSNDILGAAGVSGDIRVKDLSEEDVRKISRVLEDVGGVEGDLRKEISMNIKRLMEIGCYRGLRGRKRRPLARALEANAACARPRDHVALGVGDGDVRVVERGVDMHVAVVHHPLLAALLEGFLGGLLTALALLLGAPFGNRCR